MKFILQSLIQIYRYTLSPVFALFGVRCRFLPSCSAYGLEAITRHGAWHGSLITAKRLCHCHPWGGAGYDPVPQTLTPPKISPFCPQQENQ
jgi:uncharacterized protein